MKIVKAGMAQSVRDDAAAELESINTFARTKLEEKDVYMFSVLLCDNEVDRDTERFTEKTLEELRELFVGKTGISDHRWSSDGQKARIYRTELIRDTERKNSLGEEYVYLKGYAYMLRTEGNAELIAEIDGGIKRETSVGCSVAQTLCSICGEELGSCGHVKGEEYGGKLCFGELCGAVDAYEWSFVAVPAQKQAGVIKGLEGAKSLKSFIESRRGQGYMKEFAKLEKEAAVGRKYMEETRGEVLRLCMMWDMALYGAVKKSVETMSAEELQGMKNAMEAKLSEKMPMRTQLPGRDQTVTFERGEYMV